MFHSDLHKSLRDTEEVKSLRERQPMQSMDEQPWQQATSQPAPDNQTSWERQWHPGNPQEPHLDQKVGDSAQSPDQSERQANEYQGVSERIPFGYPPAPATYPPAMMQPQPEPAWTYPPRPEQYHSRTFGQPVAAGTIQPAQPGQPGQQGAPSGGMYGAFSQSAEMPPGNPPYGGKRSGLRTGAIIALVALLAAVFGTGLFAGWQFSRINNAPTSPTVLQPGNNSTIPVPQLTGNNADVVREAVINKVRPGVVQIDVISSNTHALGSGVIIDGRGYIATNHHVVANATSIQVTLADGSSQSARLVGTDAADDLAIIKITPPSSGLSVVTVGDSSQLRVGQEVLAIGSPLGNAQTVTSGIISAVSRNVSEGQNGPTLPDAIQTDAPINPGNSGGALVDMQGNLIGIPTLNAIDTEFNTPANGLGFAIPANRVKFIAQQLIADGRVTHTGRAILGVGVASVDQNIARQSHLGVNYGVLVESVTSNGPAATAGLKTNDVIVQLSDKAVHNTNDLSRALLQHNPGETVPVKLYRGSQVLTLNVSLGELPAS